MWTKKPKESPFNSLRVFGNGDKASLKYLRVVATDCNLHSREVSCWEEIKNRFELKSAQMPVCSGYKGIYKYDEESAIAYPVEVSLFPKPTTKTIAGPLRCWPAD